MHNRVRARNNTIFMHTMHTTYGVASLSLRISELTVSKSRSHLSSRPQRPLRGTRLQACSRHTNTTSPLRQSLCSLDKLSRDIVG